MSTDQLPADNNPRGSGPRVIKLGGSLLERPTWPDDFRRWLASQPPAPNIIIVGGGSLVDAIRHLDEIHKVPAAEAHWLAISAMSVTARLARSLLPDAQRTNEWCTVHEFANSAGTDRQLLVFDAARFLETLEPTLPGERLPASWDVTSDSIAARIAGLLEARELVLIKSCGAGRQAAPFDAAANAGIVDRAFPHFARRLRRVTFVDLSAVPS